MNIYSLYFFQSKDFPKNSVFFLETGEGMIDFREMKFYWSSISMDLRSDIFFDGLDWCFFYCKKDTVWFNDSPIIKNEVNNAYALYKKGLKNESKNTKSE